MLQISESEWIKILPNTLCPEFPPVEEALKGEHEGLLACAGCLNVDWLMEAYCKGIFPWYSNKPILWWSPNPRFILKTDKFRISDSLKRVIKSGKFKIRVDQDFNSVMLNCASAKRNGQKGSWINPDMIRVYSELNGCGFAHSVEAYVDDRGVEILVGGLYGVSVGRMFYGESMFSLEPNSSKVCLALLSDFLNSNGVEIIDCQVYSKHLEFLGAEFMPRDEFAEHVRKSVNGKGIEFPKVIEFGSV